MIVVETNVIVSLYLETSASHDAERALARNADWAAPLPWRSEMRNVLATLQRDDRLGRTDALAIADEAEGLLHGREYSVPTSDVLDLAARSGCTAYDCEFVALALLVAAPLVTLDRALLRAFPQTAVRLGDFAS